MPGGPRPLPNRPSLRYLKLEAKRRLAAGEFPTLHHAQAAIASEYGQQSWAGLKQYISGQPQRESHALPQLRWLIARFKDSGEQAWTAPGEDELRQHFSDEVLGVVSAGELVSAITSVAADLREEFAVVDQAPLWVHVRIAGTDLFAGAEAELPHRLTAVQRIPRGGRITDPRVASPAPARTLGDVPADVPGFADEVFGELGLTGLILAGGGPGIPAWTVAKGWANLERGEILDTGHRFPGLGIAALVTVTAVLRLVADGRFALDSPANDHLRTVRLADGTITVRELLSHSSSIDNILANPLEVFADSAPDLAALTGPVIGCGGPRGVVRLANSGYAVLGQLIADVTGSRYADVAARLVLEPLGMSRAADIGPDAVTGYSVTATGTFAPAAAAVCVMPAAGGLWTTASDVVRLGTGWSSLLPAALTHEALTPQAADEHGARHAGLGWIMRPRGDTAFLSGASLDAVASLTVRIRDNRVMTNRLIPIDPIDDRMLRSWTNPLRAEKEGPS